MNRPTRMPCHISDSIPYAELTEPYVPDEDEQYERLRAEELTDDVLDEINRQVDVLTGMLREAG